MLRLSRFRVSGVDRIVRNVVSSSASSSAASIACVRGVHHARASLASQRSLQHQQTRQQTLQQTQQQTLQYRRPQQHIQSFHTLPHMRHMSASSAAASAASSSASSASSSSAAAAQVMVVPSLGDSITEGTIVQWTKAVGDYVAVDEVIAVLETDKVSVDIRAEVGGTVTELCAEENDTVAVGAELVKIEPGDAPEGYSAESEAPAAEAAAAPAAAPPAAAAAAPPAAAAAAAAAPAAPTPAAKPAAAKPAAAAPAPPRPPAGSRNETRVPVSRMRQTIAQRLKDAQNTAAMLTTFNEIDMTNIMALRNQYKDAFQNKHGVKLGFMSAFVKASVAALLDNPDVNAQFTGDEVVYKDYCDVSVAVATPTGLVVPVLRNAESMSFHDVEANIAALGAKARDGKITLEDMSGGTFTISNGGVYGSLMGTPIINPPQSAILGMHGIFQRPMAINGQVEIRPMMYVALTYDHRIIDGKGAVTFLRKVKDCIEDPVRMLLEV